MKNLSIEELKEAAVDTWRIEPKPKPEGPPAIAVVVRADLRVAFISSLNAVKPEAQQAFSEWIGREAYFVENQTDDCLVFHARDELRAYLNERHAAKVLAVEPQPTEAK